MKATLLIKEDNKARIAHLKIKRKALITFNKSSQQI